jgi:hypothetical protein
MGIKDKQDFTIPLLRAAGEAIQKWLIVRQIEPL